MEFNLVKYSILTMHQGLLFLRSATGMVALRAALKASSLRAFWQHSGLTKSPDKLPASIGGLPPLIDATTTS